MSRVKQLEEEILRHKKLYYSGMAEISDEEYDKLETELKEVDPNNKILSFVGTPVVNNKIKHDEKMLSLNKTYKVEELVKWKESYDIVSTFKIDGSSCSLIYINGELTLGKTRGDGEYGENITQKINHIPSIPKKIKSIGKVEVRGEIYINETNFVHLCDEMEKLGLEKPTSQRNIVAGILSRKENIELSRFLQFQSFELIGEKSIKSENDKFLFMRKQGFEIPDFKTLKNTDDINDILEEAKDFIENGDFLIDGIVFTFNDVKLHEELGATAHHPKYKMAFKFQGSTKVATIDEITWQVSRNGVLTPVAEIKPVELSGAMISRVTLHNYGLVNEFKLKKGDQIEIVRSGEVIPKFLEIKKQSNEKYSVPSECPSCSKKLSVEDIRLICTNDFCPSKVLEEITYFVQTIGIDDLSRKRLSEMIKTELVRAIPDLYDLTVEKLLTLEKTKEKLANKIFNNIKGSKKADLLTFLASLGIAGGGRNKCEKIILSGLNTMDLILKLNVEKLTSIEGFAQKSSEDFVKSLNSKKKLIEELLAKGFNPKSSFDIKESAITGKKFCITGTLSRKRSEVEKDIKENGGVIVSSVSKNTDYLVTNDTESSSSKFKKAKQLEIPILSEDKLKELIET